MSTINEIFPTTPQISKHILLWIYQYSAKFGFNRTKLEAEIVLNTQLTETELESAKFEARIQYLRYEILYYIKEYTDLFNKVEMITDYLKTLTLQAQFSTNWDSIYFKLNLKIREYALKSLMEKHYRAINNSNRARLKAEFREYLNYIFDVKLSILESEEIKHQKKLIRASREKFQRLYTIFSDTMDLSNIINWDELVPTVDYQLESYLNLIFKTFNISNNTVLEQLEELYTSLMR